MISHSAASYKQMGESRHASVDAPEDVKFSCKFSHIPECGRCVVWVSSECSGCPHARSWDMRRVDGFSEPSEITAVKNGECYMVTGGCGGWSEL